MGIIHFMGLGRSPGAITAPVAYINTRLNRNNATDLRFFVGSGGRQHQDRPGMIEAVVFFTTPEILIGKFQAHDYIINQIGFESGKLVQDKPPMKSLLPKLLQKEWLPFDQSLGRDLYWVEISHTDFSLTFERIIQTYLAFSAPGKQGKEIWINLTGGLNIINLALLSAGCLSALGSRFYYVNNLGQTNGPIPREIRPVINPKLFGTREDTFWVEVPFPKMTFDFNYYAVLELLAEQPAGTGMVVNDLLSRLKSHFRYNIYFENVDEMDFRRDILLKMASRDLIAVSEDEQTISLAPAGENLLLYLDQEIFHKLIERGHLLQEAGTENLKQIWLAESWVQKSSIT